jgi:hypothetical protein
MVWSKIFETKLQSCGTRLYSPVFLNNLQKRSQSKPNRTIASLSTTQFFIFFNSVLVS